MRSTCSVKGEAGGPWGVLGWTWPTLHGPEAVPYQLELNGLHSRVRAGESFELEMEPIRNPVSGAEVTPGAVLPQGIVFKRGDFASSKRYRVERLGFDYAGRYTAVGAVRLRGSLERSSSAPRRAPLRTRFGMTLRRRGGLGECDARTQGAPICDVGATEDEAARSPDSFRGARLPFETSS